MYKVRKECNLCKEIFFPKYSGTFYCDKCKTRHKIGGDHNVKTISNTTRYRERLAKLKIEDQLRKYKHI